MATTTDNSPTRLWEGGWKSTSNPNNMFGKVYMNLPRVMKQCAFDSVAHVDYLGMFKSGLRIDIPVTITIESQTEETPQHSMSMTFSVGPSTITYTTTYMTDYHIQGEYTVSFPKDCGLFDLYPSVTGKLPPKESACVVL